MSGLADLFSKVAGDASVGAIRAGVFGTSFVVGLGILAGFDVPFFHAAVISGVAALVVLAVAMWLGRVPRAPKGAIGILVGIDTEGADAAARLKADFMAKLRGRAAALSRFPPIAIVQLDARRTASLTGEAEMAETAARYGYGFAIFGRARVRLLDGVEQYVCDLRLLSSGLGDESETKAIEREATRIVRDGFLIPEDGAVLGFAVASDLVAVAAQYMIALVAGVEDELEYSDEMFAAVRSELGKRAARMPMLVEAKRAADHFHVKLLRVKVNRAYRRWGRARDQEALIDFERENDRLLDVAPDDTYGLQSKAITAFLLHRDVGTAWECVRRCEAAGSTGPWRYSEAFLYLYQGKLDRARAAYEAAVEEPGEEESDYIQAEQFIHEIFENEPQRIQLLFGLGTINLLVKQDLEAAERDFSRFRELDVSRKFGKYHVWAEEQLAALREGRARPRRRRKRRNRGQR